MRKSIKLFLWIILAVFLVRVFIYQTYTVDSFSMSSNLIPGDKVLVNKYKTGIRLPNSILGLPGTERSYIDALRIPYLRLPGFRKFKSQDIVVFNDPRITDKPVDKSPLMLSRIAGLPGDTLYILNKDLYVNQNKIEDSPKFRRLYRVVTDGQEIPGGFIKEFLLEEPVLIADIGIYDISMDSVAHAELLRMPFVKTIRLRQLFFGDSSKGYFPYSSFFNWNRDQYGPLIVPVKGLELGISLKNVDLFREIIDIYEGNDLIVDFSGVTINGKKADTYTFKKNYYFVVDDNRDNPNDSRIIGFVPESHILGTSSIIINSGKSSFAYLEKPGISRVLKKID